MHHSCLDILRMTNPRVTNRILEDEILDIIAAEVGVSRCELLDDTQFADLGIDGLLSKTIVSRITKTLNIELPATIFQEYPDVESLRVNFKGAAKLLAVPAASAPTTGRISPANEF